MIGRTAHLPFDFNRQRGLSFDHIGIVKRRQEIPALLYTPRLSGGERFPYAFIPARR